MEETPNNIYPSQACGGTLKRGLEHRIRNWSCVNPGQTDWEGCFEICLYDFPLFVLRGLKKQEAMQEGLAWGMFVFFLAVLVFMLVWTLRIVRRLRREQIQEAEQERGREKG
jgi:hypothetical protein